MSSLAVLKHYTDRAVQTDADAVMSPPGPGFTIDISDTSTCFLPALKTVSPVEIEPSMDVSAKSSAYMRSKPLSSDDPVEILASGKDRKLLSLASGLGYPSTCLAKTERVVSLPEHSLCPDVAHSALVETQKRVVSMPERGKLSNLVSVSENAGTTANFGTGSTARSHPYDVPRTPSPPSSPDSVMIIANEGQVSSSFLQSGRRSFITEDGWVTWASSPPRPIPALHGPLSLPYARCPSGAEGTVVEGDDLSHKIWGLGADDTPAHTRYQRTLPHIAPQPIPANYSSDIKAHILDDRYQASSHQRRRGTVIDLSQPSTFDHIQDAAQQGQRNSVKTAARGPIFKDANNLPDFVTSAMAKLANLPHGRQHDQDAPKKPYAVEAATSDQLGLALQWESLFDSDPKARAWTNGPKSLGTSQESSYRLNTSAPPFVPQNCISPSLIDKAILQDKPRDGRAQSTQKLGQCSVDAPPPTHTLRDHNAQSPPSTVSPLWTPIFNQTADMHHSHGKTFVTRAGRQMPDIYSPELDRGGYQPDQLEGLRAISQIQSYDLQNPSHRHKKDRYSSQVSLGDSYCRQESSYPRDARPPIDIHSERSPVLFDASNYGHGGGNTTTSTAMMDRRRSLTQQQPRSIPLARLIQRRLSSVVEEESLGGAYGDNPPMSSSNYLCQTLPSGAPIRLLPVSSSETMRTAYSSSTAFTPRERLRILGSAHSDDREAKSVSRGNAVAENSRTVPVPVMGTGRGGSSSGKLQQMTVKDDQSKATAAKLPVPRVDSAPRGSSTRSGGSRPAMVTRENVQSKSCSREDSSNAEEKDKENVDTGSKTGPAGKTPKKPHYKHKKRAERVSGQVPSKADCST